MISMLYRDDDIDLDIVGKTIGCYRYSIRGLLQDKMRDVSGNWFHVLVRPRDELQTAGFLCSRRRKICIHQFSRDSDSSHLVDARPKIELLTTSCIHRAR